MRPIEKPSSLISRPAISRFPSAAPCRPSINWTSNPKEDFHAPEVKRRSLQENRPPSVPPVTSKLSWTARFFRPNWTPFIATSRTPTSLVIRPWRMSWLAVNPVPPKRRPTNFPRTTAVGPTVCCGKTSSDFGSTAVRAGQASSSTSGASGRCVRGWSRCRKSQRACATIAH